MDLQSGPEVSLLSWSKIPTQSFLYTANPTSSFPLTSYIFRTPDSPLLWVHTSFLNWCLWVAEVSISNAGADPRLSLQVQNYASAILSEFSSVWFLDAQIQGRERPRCPTLLPGPPPSQCSGRLVTCKHLKHLWVKKERFPHACSLGSRKKMEYVEAMHLEFRKLLGCWLVG